MSNIALISTEDGTVLNTLPPHAFVGSASASPFAKSEPKGYFDEENMIIEVKVDKKKITRQLDA